MQVEAIIACHLSERLLKRRATFFPSRPSCFEVIFGISLVSFWGLLGAPSIIAGAPSTYCEKSQMPLLFFKKKAVHPTTLSSSFSASLFSFILLPFLRAFLLLLLSSASLFNFFLPPSSFFREPICFSSTRWLFFFRASCCFSLLRVRFFFHSAARCCSSILHRGKVYYPFSCLLLLSLVIA